MRPSTPVVLAVGAVAAFAIGIAVFATLRRGFGANDEPSQLESVLARTVRRLAVPDDLRSRRNPVAATPAVLAGARAHFADHCATCHGNNGRGTGVVGAQMYPRSPDLTLPATQSASDGELFSVIENGVRLTGMPAFGNGTAASAAGSWALVHFIRHLPAITSAEIGEMEAMNPKSPAEWKQMQEEAAFLEGSDLPAALPADHAVAMHH